GGFARGPDLTDGYRRGYLCGIIRGDGLLDTYRYDGRRRARDVQHQFRLALIDLEALRRAKTYLADARIETTEFAFSAAHGDRAAMTGIRTHAQSQVRAIRELVAWPEEPGVDWTKGYLAGIFDSEGSCSRGVLRHCNKHPDILSWIQRSIASLRFEYRVEGPRDDGLVNIRLLGGLRERTRFFHTVDPAITRKLNIDGLAVKGRAVRVRSIEPLGV